ncbi:MAG: hypothetical protein M1816_004331 [Peltula sp. TS41687]|nr:MAG: hypothetical protein M1816_004331 [Peltula sp. TS41687]
MAIEPDSSPNFHQQREPSSSEPCSNPRRDSTEDADPTMTRKRQRLETPTERTVNIAGIDINRPADGDSAIAASRPPSSSPPVQGNLSRSVRTPTTPSPPSPQDQRRQQQQTPPPPVPSQSPRTPTDKMTRLDHPPLSRTSSKVTINVRGPRPETPSVASHQTSPISDREASARDVQQDPSTATTDDTPGPLSPATSSVRSPEVEIAEVEEMDQDYAVNEWDPLLESDGRVGLIERFPFYVKDAEMRDVVLQVSRTMEKGEPSSFGRADPLGHETDDAYRGVNIGVTNGTVISEIANWIALCVERAERKQMDWYDVWSENQDFWDEIPAIFEGLLKRRTAFEDHFIRQSTTTGVESEQNALEYLFVQFARLVSQLIRVDLNTLQTSPDLTEEPDLISPRFQLIFSWVLLVSISNDIPLWRLLQDYYDYDVSGLGVAVATNFLAGLSDPLGHLSRFIQLTYDRMVHCPKMSKSAFYPVLLVHRLVGIAMDRASGSAAGDDPYLNLWRQIPRHAAEIGRRLDAQLQIIIQKQINLNRDFIKDMCHQLPQLLLDVSQADLEVGQALFRERGGTAGPDDLAELPQLVLRAWKFALLKQCITSGRMEVRVQALDNMCTDLVDAYKQYGAHRCNYPVMQYLANFILDNKLVEYLVGVESHIQLVERSANVAGFLVVTHKYTTHESDAIWHVVRTNQDPRFVSAVLRMLRGIFSVAHYRNLLYFCQKLNEMPLESFDGGMLDYAGALLGAIREKLRLIQQRELDMPPYELCIRLIRKAAALQSDHANGLSTVFHFASRELQDLLRWGPSLEDRRAIYVECVQDITAKRTSSTGSICVVNYLLLQGQSTRDATLDLDTLASEFDLTRLVIEETAHTLRLEPSPISLPNGEIILTSRLDLLARIITGAPNTIDSTLGERLWKCIAENKALSPGQRDLGWGMLCTVTGRLRTRNAFIDQCIETHLPRLQPQYFTLGVLNMAQQVIQYEHRMVPQRPPSEHEIIQITGAELVWRIILTAPNQTIEEQAIHYFVSQYLDASIIRNAPRSAVEATHLALVDRCVRQLTSAASKLKAFSDGTTSGEDEPMVIVASDAEVMAQELRFGRSLMLLRDILHGMRQRPHYSPKIPKTTEEPQVTELSQGGDLIRVRYQAFAPDESSPPAMQEIEIGDLEACQVLKARLSHATGFAHFRTLSGGREIFLDKHPSKTLREMQLGPQPLMISKRDRPPVETSDRNFGEGLVAVEIELLKHFDDLYDLLGLEERLAEQIWGFLNDFPSQDRIRRLIMSNACTELDAFPVGQPFKMMYSVATMQNVLAEQEQKGIVSGQFISRCVRLLVAALTNDALLHAVVNEHLRLKALSKLVHCLLLFLRAPVAIDVSATFFDSPADLADHFMGFFNMSKSPNTWHYEESLHLTRDTFSCALQAALHDAAFWHVFSHRDDVPDLVQRLVLGDFRIRLRESIGILITGFCRLPISNANAVNSRDLAEFFWRLLSSILPMTADRVRQPQSGQLFEVSLSVLRTMGEFWRESLDLDGYVTAWGSLLMDHHHEEVCRNPPYPTTDVAEPTQMVGRDTVDYFVYGFARLLNYCVKLASSRGKPVRARQLAEKIFTGFLFPDLSSWTTSERITERVPVLHSPTRKELNELVLLLSQDMESYKKTLKLLLDLVPNSYAYSLGWNFQRPKSIRSPTGYVGLFNLSNTCYLNSLFTQLFMNVAFRGFMLQANVPDADGSQKLLSETQKLFAYMQNSWQVAVEPKELAGAIRTYDNEHIDVTVQMDVDEFYNLLFDRWEGQILSDEDKKVFRSFYGGQLVQQVKSKECPHVSEREEPFSAIQCDIKGKSTLQESLKAYVEGDMMEGEVPDNLIFHLKRFDFDLRTMQRSKINDYFEFPRTIDMRPYKIEQLSDPELATPEDMFELVGVLVHSGTAESGHYYSFIRERPITSISQSPDWVQYNDSEVQYWNPANIAAQCFGGTETWTQSKDSQPLVLPKSYSAYMLFYQRSSSIRREQEEHYQQGPSGSLISPKKQPVSLELSNHIALENELFIRKYCMYDEYHSLFIRWVFDLLRQINNGACSEDHQVEQSAITMALNHLDQVLARTKDSPFFDEMINVILKRVASCMYCCKFVLDWVVTYPDPTRVLFLRSPSAKVRQEVSRLIFTALRELRDKNLGLYGADLTTRDPDHMVAKSGTLYAIVSHLDDFWEQAEIHLRAWDDYFGLVAQIASLGELEIMLVLRKGFLRRCLEILVAENEPSLRLEYERMLRVIGKGRKASYNKLIELLRMLVEALDLGSRNVATDEEDRWLNDSPEAYPLTRAEAGLLRLHVTRTKIIIFLRNILDLNHNPASAVRIVAEMVRCEPGFGVLNNLCKTLLAGIAIDPASLAGPYLEAAIVTCQHAPSPNDIKEIILRTARDVDTIGAHGGREHLNFFRDLAQLKNERWPHNPLYFCLRVLEYIQLWAPPLLLYWDLEVREETETLLHRILFDHGVPAATSYPELDEALERAGRELGHACLGKLYERYTEMNVQVDRKVLESIMRVVNECRAYYPEDETDFTSKRDLILANLRELVIDEADDAASGTQNLFVPESNYLSWEVDEWDNESNAASDSSEVDVTLQGESGSP